MSLVLIAILSFPLVFVILVFLEPIIAKTNGDKVGTWSGSNIWHKLLTTLYYWVPAWIIIVTLKSTIGYYLPIIEKQPAWLILVGVILALLIYAFIKFHNIIKQAVDQLFSGE